MSLPPPRVDTQLSQCHLWSGLFPCCFEILPFFLFSLSVSLICLSLFLLAYFLVEEWLTVNMKMISKRKVYKENKQNAISAVTGELLKNEWSRQASLKEVTFPLIREPGRGVAVCKSGESAFQRWRECLQGELISRCSRGRENSRRVMGGGGERSL